MTQSPSEGLVTAGWALAILVPPLGLILGVLVVGKGRTSTGVGIMLLSVAMGLFIWAYVAGDWDPA